MNTKKVAVLLSGCGFKDGTEITEAVSALVALSEFQTKYQVFAPDVTADSVNHIDDSSEPARRSLIEAARIARGQIQDLKNLRPADFDALVIPGGFGAAKVLCTFATAGHKCEVLPEVERVIKAFHKEEKPIAAMCIAPALVARVLGDKGVSLTIGNDSETAAEINKTGAHHEECSVNDFITDREHRVITTPAYMYGDAKPHEVFQGVRLAIKELVEMA